jgi:hypothetical protein
MLCMLERSLCRSVTLALRQLDRDVYLSICWLSEQTLRVKHGSNDHLPRKHSSSTSAYVPSCEAVAAVQVRRLGARTECQA